MTCPCMEDAYQQTHSQSENHTNNGTVSQRNAKAFQKLSSPRHDDSTQRHLRANGQVNLAGDDDQTHTIGNNALHGGVTKNVQDIPLGQKYRLCQCQSYNNDHQQQLNHVIEQEVIGFLLGKQTHFRHFQLDIVHSIFPPMQSAYNCSMVSSSG